MRPELIHGKKIIVIMPARNVRATVSKTILEIPAGFIDEILIGDNQSTDGTADVAEGMGRADVTVIRHPRDFGYGGNVKALCREAISRGADAVVMVHPDYQYPPKLAIPMASMIASGQFDLVVGSRLVGDRTALACGMPPYKYLSNRLLTIYQNAMTSMAASELHSGMRAMSRSLLTELPIDVAHDGYGFDNDLQLMAKWFGKRIGEVSAPTNYAPEASSNPFRGSMKYGMRCVRNATRYRLAKWKILSPGPLFSPRSAG